MASSSHKDKRILYRVLYKQRLKNSAPSLRYFIEEKFIYKMQVPATIPENLGLQASPNPSSSSPSKSPLSPKDEEGKIRVSEGPVTLELIAKWVDSDMAVMKRRENLQFNQYMNDLRQRGVEELEGRRAAVSKLPRFSLCPDPVISITAPKHLPKYPLAATITLRLGDVRWFPSGSTWRWRVGSECAIASA